MSDLTRAYLGADLTVEFTKLAIENIEETGLDWTSDYHDLRTGQVTSEELLEKCLDGADADRVDGWNEYVWSLETAVGK